GGELQIFDEPVFHVDFAGQALEMREFSEAGLRTAIREAGFDETRVYSRDYAPYGIVHAEACSLPIAARKGNFALGRDATRDVVEQWAELRRAFDREMRKLGRSYWFRLGRKIGVF